uniref:Bm8825, isoform b n=2 Tax=Brugia TaxID=6278 RepID=A0A1I9G7D9_BRUMA|nr:Bm8825, isoform b [Brugia malayi]
MAEWSKAPDSSNNVYASHENLKVCLGCSGIVIDAWVNGHPEVMSALEPRNVIYTYTGIGNFFTPFVIFFVFGTVVSFGLTMLHIPMTNMIIDYVRQRELTKEEKKEAKRKEKEMEEEEERKESNRKK